MSRTSYYDEELDLLLSQLDRSYQQDYVITSVAQSKGCGDVGKYMKERRLRKEQKLRNEKVMFLNKKKSRKGKENSIRAHRDIKLFAESGEMGVTDNTSGIQLVSRLKTVDAGADGYAGDHTLSDATIKETTWDLNRVIERPMLVGTWTWDATMTNVVARLDTPTAMIQNISLTRSPFNMFQYWRGDITFKLQIVGSPLMSGCIAMTFVPLTTSVELDNMVASFTSMSVNPTVLGFANANTNAELRVPFNSFYSYLDINNTDDFYAKSLGYLVIYVIDPLLVAGSTNAVSLSLFATFSDNEFKVPRLSTVTMKMEQDWIKKYENDTRRKALRAEAGLLASLGETLTGIVKPVIGQLASSAVGAVSGNKKLSKKEIIDSVDSRAMPANFVGDALDVASGLLGSALTMFGLDNPTIPTVDSRTIVKANDSMNYCVGPVYIDKMTMNPSSLPLVTPETFSTMEDQMSFSFLYSKYTFMQRFSIAVGDKPAALVASWQLHPQASLTTSTGDAAYVVGRSQAPIPLLAYLGFPFRYWTGSLNYKFVVSASMMHTCKLFVSFQYGMYIGKPVNLFDVSSQYGTVIEISQGSNEFEFSVPYVSNLPYLETTSGTLGPGSSMGTLNVFVLNSLVAPSSVAQAINIMVFTAGGDDFRYEWPGYWNPVIPVIYAQVSTEKEVENSRLQLLNGNKALNDTFFGVHNVSHYANLHAESGIMQEQTSAPTNNDTVTIDQVNPEVEQVAPPQLPILVDEHFGTMIGSVKELLKKYQFSQILGLQPYLGTASFYTEIPNNHVIRVAAARNPTDNMSADSRGMMTWASAMYRQFKGSIRYKIISEVGSIIRVYLQPGRNPRQTNVSYTYGIGPTNGRGVVSGDNLIMFTPRSSCMTHITTGMSNVAEFEVPYTMPYHSVRNTFIDDEDTCRDTSFILVVVEPPAYALATAAHVVEVYAALGDEARFGTLYRMPSLFVPFIASLSTPTTPTGNTGYGTYAMPP